MTEVKRLIRHNFVDASLSPTPIFDAWQEVVLF